MVKQNNFQGISKRAQALLDAGESKAVDYKEKVKGLHSEDLVAFANSENGGAILIGVREISGHHGKQKGESIGHSIDDDSRLQIMGKTLSCSPPIQVEIFIENLRHLPFYRVEIPTGAQKPYATNSGTYKIREDGRNNPLLPEQLLKMFLEREGEEFRSRFSEATGKLESSMKEALGLVEKLAQVISEKIEDIGSSLGWAEYKAGDAADTIEIVRQNILSLTGEAKKQKQRIKAVISEVGADDPIKRKAEEETVALLINKLKEDAAMLAAVKKGEGLSVSLSGDAAEELDKEDLQRLLGIAIEKVMAENSNA